MRTALSAVLSLLGLVLTAQRVASQINLDDVQLDAPKKPVLDAAVNPVYEEELATLATEAKKFQNVTITDQEQLLGPGSVSVRSNPEPIRIRLDFDQMTDGGDPALKAKQDFIRDEVMPMAAGELNKYFKVKSPTSGPLTLTPVCVSWWELDGEILCVKYSSYFGTYNSPGFCSSQDNVQHNQEFYGSSRLCTTYSLSSCTTTSGGSGYADTDLLVYVIADQSKCSGELAHAGACVFDSVTGRPTAGWVAFCPNSIDLDYDTVTGLAQTAIHEILHVMYFSNWQMKNDFVDADGNVLPESSVITTDSLNRPAVITPKVLEVAKDFYNCLSLTSVPLEDGGGSGSTGSHWEASVVRGDIMGARATYSGKDDMGPLTVALAEDSGWYQGIWENVGHTPFGYQSGCSLASTACTAYSPLDPWHDLFCSASTNQVSCSPDHRFMGSCQSDSTFHPGCTAVYEASYFSFIHADLYANCYDPAMDALADGFMGNAFGKHHRCIDAVGAIKSPDNYNYAWSRCVKMSCTLSNLLQIEIGGTTFDCPTGDIVDISSLSGWAGKVGPCPDNEQICGTLSCQEDCNGHGRCVDGKCSCNVGFAGPSCAEDVCTPQNCDTTCMPGTGQCFDPTPTTPNLLRFRGVGVLSAILYKP